MQLGSLFLNHIKCSYHGTESYKDFSALRFDLSSVGINLVSGIQWCAFHSAQLVLVSGVSDSENIHLLADKNIKVSIHIKSCNHSTEDRPTVTSYLNRDSNSNKIGHLVAVHSFFTFINYYHAI